MNSIIQEYYPIFQMYQSLREQLMDSLTDEDLAYSPGGDNMTLGFRRDIMQVEEYADGFATEYGYEFDIDTGPKTWAEHRDYAEFFTGVDPAPARAALEARALPKGALVEIEAVAKAD